jgi:propanol-preferring alcohol dehydrogenase
MTAVQRVRWESEAELRDVPEPAPGPGAVLLRVDAVGICHSDLHLMEWPEGTLPYRLPFTLGHETAGTVAAVGAGVTWPQEGERVLVYGPWGCGTCWRCAQGQENICPRA